MVFNATELLITAFVNELKQGYRKTYGGYRPDYEDIIGWVGSMALENIANSDALYHNVEHTILVTLVGQEILRGKHIREGGVTTEDWLHFIVSLVCHDIGYLKKIAALFYEFEETGVNKHLNYQNPEDLRNNYPKFYWHGVYPYVRDALNYLALTQQGKQIIANLYSNVFMVEHIDFTNV